MKTHSTLLFIVFAIIFLMTGDVMATYISGDFENYELGIDFRDDAWSGAYGQHTWSVDGISAGAWYAGGGEAYLYQDGLDGLGILGGEPDEIDNINDNELLTVSFATELSLAGLLLTDLFAPGDGGAQGEHAKAEFHFSDGSPTSLFEFFGQEQPGVNNGYFYWKFDEVLENVESVDFWAAGGVCNNEFSVAGFDPVPEPSAILLLCSGLIGLVGITRRFGRK